MTTLIVDLPVDLYERLNIEATYLGTSAQALARDFLTERLTPPSQHERERVTEVLQATGLLTELGVDEKQRAAQSSATLTEVRAALDRVDGRPLSEMIIEMRGSKT